jgi:hypothetical protein
MMACATAPATREPPPEPPREQYDPTPASLLTPDATESRIGRLEFFDGLPSESTVDLLYDHLDFMRGVRAYLYALPGVSMMAMRAGMDQAGMLPNYSVLLTESLLDSKSLFLTQDTESVYAFAWISLKGGPIVIETPPRAQGVFVDAWQQPLAETGKAGADRGRGGRYVIVPPAYAGYVPRTKYAVESPTFGVWAIFRGFLSQGSPSRAIQTFKESLKIYPLREANRPPPNVFIDVSGRAFNTVPPTDSEFFELLDELLQEEPNESQDPEILGIFASLGIEKDRRFEPEERMKAILADAAAVGNATARALLFSPRDDDARLYEDREWERIFAGGSHTFIDDGALRNDARARLSMLATAVTPTMESPKMGSSVDSAVTFRDSRGQPLDGGRTYTLTLPSEIPAEFFWSLTVYDTQTRSMLQTNQRFPSILGGQAGLQKNDDDSITLRFGPEEPRDRRTRANWIQTTPDTGWFAIVRLYGPEEAWFEGSWKPGDVELVLDVPRTTSGKSPPATKTEIPTSILTPNRVETRIGTLEFVNGVPTQRTVERVYEHLDFIRGVDAFLSTVPGASLVAMRRGLREAGVTGNNVVGIFDGPIDAHSLLLTPSAEGVFALTWLDLRDGALVLEHPPKALGIVDDFFSRHVADLGEAGPDAGKGGAYLFVPPMYEGQISDLYFNFVSSTYGNILLWRRELSGSDAVKSASAERQPTPTAQVFEDHVQIYPLEFEITDEEIEAMGAAKQVEEIDDDEGGPEVEEEEAPDNAAQFVSLTGRPINTIHSSDFKFYEEINELVQEEPAEALGPALLGLLASVGIRKSQPFDPNPRIRFLLTQAARVADATARALAFRPRDESAYLYEGSGWYMPLVGNSHDFVRRGVRLQDARTMFFYLTTMTTPTMVHTKLGQGSQSVLAATDARGRFLDGSKRYRLALPPGIPAKDFWSIVVYDPQTRSMLQTPRSPTPGLSSRRETVQPEIDGSTAIYFGPTPPPGKEDNWIQTVPGKGWFTVLRLHGLEEAWFDETWRPGDIEEIDWP